MRMASGNRRSLVRARECGRWRKEGTQRTISARAKLHPARQAARANGWWIEPAARAPGRGRPMRSPDRPCLDKNFRWTRHAFGSDVGRSRFLGRPLIGEDGRSSNPRSRGHLLLEKVGSHAGRRGSSRRLTRAQEPDLKATFVKIQWLRSIGKKILTVSSTDVTFAKSC
jgi:hypothetical protein